MFSSDAHVLLLFSFDFIDFSHAHITSGVILMVRKIPHCWTKKRDGTCVKLLCTQDVEVFKNAKVVLFRWGFSFSVPLFTLFPFLFRLRYCWSEFVFGLL